MGDTWTIAKDNMKAFEENRAGRTSLGLKMMINGLETYCDGIREQFELLAGDDGFLSEYVECLAKDLIGILSGPGMFDGGTLETAIREICSKANIELE